MSDDRMPLRLQGVVHTLEVSPTGGSWEYMLTITPKDSALLTEDEVDALVEYLRPGLFDLVRTAGADLDTVEERLSYLLAGSGSGLKLLQRLLSRVRSAEADREDYRSRLQTAEVNWELWQHEAQSRSAVGSLDVAKVRETMRAAYDVHGDLWGTFTNLLNEALAETSPVATPNLRESLALKLWDEGLVRPESMAFEVVDSILSELGYLTDVKPSD